MANSERSSKTLARSAMTQARETRSLATSLALTTSKGTAPALPTRCARQCSKPLPSVEQATCKATTRFPSNLNHYRPLLEEIRGRATTHNNDPAEIRQTKTETLRLRNPKPQGLQDSVQHPPPKARAHLNQACWRRHDPVTSPCLGRV